MAGLRVVVGLGNPGERYARTRHNVGFRLVEALAEGPWKAFGAGETSRRGALILGKPLTYMNDSGPWVRELARFYKAGPKEVLVCFDEIALPLGRLRLRRDGSGGGQKGMESVIQALGTKDVPRLRLGIGPQPERMDSAAFVLQKFTAAEETALDDVIARAAEAVDTAARDGIEAAMNKFNAPAAEA